MKKERKRRSKLILVLGGAASGKSQAALELAGRARPRAFVATGQALDREMKERIERHQATRSSDWVTAEVPVEIGKWFSKNGDYYQSVVLDCLTLWLSNLRGRRLRDRAASEATGNLLHAIRGTTGSCRNCQQRIGTGAGTGDESCPSDFAIWLDGSINRWQQKQTKSI